MSNWSHWWGLPFIYSQRHSPGALYFATEVALAKKAKRENNSSCVQELTTAFLFTCLTGTNFFQTLDKILPNNNRKHLKMTVILWFFYYFFFFFLREGLGFSRKQGLTGNGSVVNFNREWDQNTTNYQAPDVWIWSTAIEHNQIFYNRLQFS